MNDVPLKLLKIKRRRAANAVAAAYGMTAYTASDNDVKLKSRTRIDGINCWYCDSSPARISGRPSSSILFNIVTGLSLKRKFLIGCLILPFSMENVPSRVKPVSSTDCGSTMRIYQVRVTSTPFLVLAISSAVDLSVPAMMILPGEPTGRWFIFLAQYSE